jgi:uncharacterized protein (TIGR02996 family)
MTTHTHDALALLAAIRANPDEDTPRLMFADVLEESDPARAELIRVQCELAKFACESPSVGAVIAGKPAPCFMCRHRNKKDCLPWCASCCGREDRMNRESTLLTANADRWRKGPVCEKCGGSGEVGKQVSRSVRQVDAKCPDCFGTGDAGGLMRKFTYEYGGDGPEGPYIKHEPVRITYHRGMKRALCRAADVWEKCCGLCEGRGWDLHPKSRCMRCDGDGKTREQYESTWRPTAWARAVCTHHPDVVELWVRDREPSDYRGTGDRLCGFWRGESTAIIPKLPEPVWDEVATDPHVYQRNGNWIDFSTPDAARLALARAVVRWVHAAPAHT